MLLQFNDSWEPLWKFYEAEVWDPILFFFSLYTQVQFTSTIVLIDVTNFNQSVLIRDSNQKTSNLTIDSIHMLDWFVLMNLSALSSLILEKVSPFSDFPNTIYKARVIWHCSFSPKHMNTFIISCTNML